MKAIIPFIPQILEALVSIFKRKPKKVCVVLTDAAEAALEN